MSERDSIERKDHTIETISEISSKSVTFGNMDERRPRVGSGKKLPFCV